MRPVTGKGSWTKGKKEEKPLSLGEIGKNPAERRDKVEKRGILEDQKGKENSIASQKTTTFAHSMRGGNKKKGKSQGKKPAQKEERGTVQGEKQVGRYFTEARKSARSEKNL